MFLVVPAHLGCPGQRAVKHLCVCVSEEGNKIGRPSVFPPGILRPRIIWPQPHSFWPRPRSQPYGLGLVEIGFVASNIYSAHDIN